MIADLERELDALLEPMPQDGTLEGAERRRFDRLIWQIIAEQGSPFGPVQMELFT